MAIDEAARPHLYELARGTWDAKAADTLMNAIPSDLRQLATKDDLAVLGSDIRAEMADLRGELRSGIHESAASTIRTIVFAMIATNATLVGLVFAAVRLG